MNEERDTIAAWIAAALAAPVVYDSEGDWKDAAAAQQDTALEFLSEFVAGTGGETRRLILAAIREIGKQDASLAPRSWGEFVRSHRMD